MATYSRKRKYTSLLPDPSPSPPRRTPPSSSPLPTLSTRSRPALQPRDTNASCDPPSSPKVQLSRLAFNTGECSSEFECHAIPTTRNPLRFTPTTTSTTNSQHHPASTASKTPQTQKSRKTLTQLTLDLGGPVHIQCPHPRCGMQYIPSHAQDAALHRRHHASVVGTGWDACGQRSRVASARRGDGRGGAQEEGKGGWIVPKALLRDQSVERVVLKVGADSSRHRVQKRAACADGTDEPPSTLLVITRTSSISARHFAVTVLESAEAELGAVKTTSEQLWSRVCTQSRRLQSEDAEHGGRRGDGGRGDDHDQGRHSLPTPPGSSPPPPPSSHSDSKDKHVTSKKKNKDNDLKPKDRNEHKHSPTCLEDKHALILSITQPSTSTILTPTTTIARSHRSATRPAPAICTGVMLTERIYSARRIVGARLSSSSSPSPASASIPPDMQTPAQATIPNLAHQPSTHAHIQAQAQASTHAHLHVQAQTQQAQATAQTEPLTLSPTPRPAHTGISRIFVAPSHRGHGIAERMLDSLLLKACGSGGGEGDLEREEGAEGKGQASARGRSETQSQARLRLRWRSKADVAFSAPTEMGRRLVERWVGSGSGVGHGDGDGEREREGDGDGDKERQKEREGVGWMMYDDERDGFEIVGA